MKLFDWFVFVIIILFIKHISKLSYTVLDIELTGKSETQDKTLVLTEDANL